MNRFQVTAILGICILGSSVIPLLLPYSRTAASSLPDPTTLSVMIGLAGIIVLVISYVFRLKPVPANR